MPGRSGTQTLLGRGLEQTELHDALERALEGEAQVVVLSGDAGLGKTTLVADLVRHARDLGFRVGEGHCLDIDADISFAPVVEAVGSLVGDVEGPESRPFAWRLRGLLDPRSGGHAESTHLLDDLRLTVLEAAALEPVLLVLEDLHWADTSTRDLAVALSRTARDRLLLVLTVRSDDLHRRHPARKALAQIGRVPGGRRIELRPLGPDEIGGLVAAISGSEPDPATVRTVLERSEGNPLYAEEIVAAGPGPVPDDLADLFLARIDALPEESRQVARTASVDGTLLDLECLQPLSGLDDERLDACLRHLLDANVLRRDGHVLRFWHPLLRESVYGDLLPDERLRLHGRLAAILQARIGEAPDPPLSVLSRLAYHAAEAHDDATALVASERAGMAALKVSASESSTHLERALALWDRVPDAAARVGRTKIQLVVSLARAALDRGDGDRWHALNRRAIDMVGPNTESLVASWAYAAYAYSALNIDDTASAPEAVRLALQHAGDAPTEERAYALGAATLLHMVEGQFAAALPAADRAIEAARAVGAQDALQLALMFKAEALMCLGRVSDGIDHAAQRVDAARSAGNLASELDGARLLARHLLLAGRIGRATEVARAGREDGLRAGLGTSAASCGAMLVTCLIWDGRLDEAERLLVDLGDLGLHEYPWWIERADLALARGEVHAAWEHVPVAFRDVVTSGPPLDPNDAVRLLELALLADDLPRCLRTARSYLSLVSGWDSAPIASVAARLGFQALTAAGSAASVPGARVVRDLAGRALDRGREEVTEQWRKTYHGLQLALAEGYAARVDGRPGVDAFRSAAEIAESFGALSALGPGLELAEELLANGGRDEGRELLVRCWAAASEMGAGGAERRAVRLATRTRVPLPGSPAAEGPLSRLTPREREVLEQLTDGATNRAIADRLVISEKTVSVHVSHVLAKLGVQNRGAAAAVARRLSG